MTASYLILICSSILPVAGYANEPTGQLGDRSGQEIDHRWIRARTRTHNRLNSCRIAIHLVAPTSNGHSYSIRKIG